MYDDDPWMDLEAADDQRLSADMDMADMAAAGHAIDAARAAGRCCHMSSVGYRKEPCYPEQKGLKPGQSRCTEGGKGVDGMRGCGRVFTSDDDWYEAMDAAMSGDDEPATAGAR